LAKVLGLEFQQGIEAGFVVGVFGELGGEGAAELEGFGEHGIDLHTASIRGIGWIVDWDCAGAEQIGGFFV
jgi:hypothetical protein